LTREILFACEAYARSKPSGFQGLRLKQAGERSALLCSDISCTDDLKTLLQVGGRPSFSKILVSQHLKMPSIRAD
jgi:hypothetical protein